MNLITHSQAREARAIASQTDPGPKDKRRVIKLFYLNNGWTDPPPFSYDPYFELTYIEARDFFRKQLEDETLLS